MPHSLASFIPNLVKLRNHNHEDQPSWDPYLSTHSTLCDMFSTCTQIILLSVFVWAMSLEKKKRAFIQWHGQIRCSLLVSPLAMWHPSRDKSAFLGAVGPSTTHQGTWEKSRPTLCLVTMGTAMDSAVATNQLWPRGHSLGNHGEQCLGQQPTEERSFVEVQISKRDILAYHWSTNKCEFGHFGG